MLKRLFIKNYQNTNDPSVRISYGVTAGIFGIVTNLMLFAFKLLIGILAGSITIVAEAVNNLSDAGSSIMTMIGFRLSNIPADEDHPYGHARYEQITALLVAIFVLLIGVMFAKSSIGKIIEPKELSISVITYVILVIAFAMKFIQMLTYLDFAKAIDSEALRAAAMDSRNDMISTASVIVSMVIMQLFDINIDGWAGLLVSLFVIWSAVGMIKESISPMLGTPPSKELVESVCSLVDGYPELLGYHDLIIHTYGVGSAFASLHVEFDAKSDIIHVHDLIDNIEREARTALGILLTIHMDPVDVSNPRRHRLCELAESALEKYDPSLKLHDFRIVDGPSHTNVLFDIVEPFGAKYDIPKIKEMLTEEFSCEEGIYYFIINVDKKINR